MSTETLTRPASTTATIKKPPSKVASALLGNQKESSTESPKLVQRRMVAEELLTTERTYANELGRFIETFLPRMETADTASKQRFMSELSGLIHNLEQFLHISRNAVHDLESCQRTRIGPAVTRLASVLPLYTQYAKNYAAASKSIRELMNDDEFLKDWRGEERDRPKTTVRATSVRISRRTSASDMTMKQALSTGNVLNNNKNGSFRGGSSPSSAGTQERPKSEKRVTSLEGFLILPVQRVPRYVLLFQELLKRLEGELRSLEEQNERKDIQAALEAARNCAQSMNEAIENVKRLTELKDLQTRFGNDSSLLSVFSNAEAKIIRSDLLTKVSRNGTKRDFQYFLVAPDTVLCAYDDGNNGLRLRRMLKLTARTSSAEAKDDIGPSGFVLVTPDRTQTLLAPNRVVREAWVSEITRLVGILTQKSPPPIPRRSFFSRRMSSAGPSPTSAPPPPPTPPTPPIAGESQSSTPPPPQSVNHSVSSPPVNPSSNSKQSWPPPSLPTPPPPAIARSISNISQTSNASSLGEGPKDDAPNCHVCGAGFSLLHRRHACGRCSNSVCSSCSSQRRTLSPGHGNAVRICDVCGDDMDLISEKDDRNLAQVTVEVSGGFRRETGAAMTEKLSRENYWSISFGDQLMGPSGIGRFTCSIPFRRDPFPTATLLLLGKQGAVIVASATLDMAEMIRNPRSHHGFTERVDLLDIANRHKVASVCISLIVEQPPDLFLSNSAAEGADGLDGPRVAVSDGACPENKRRSLRRRSLGTTGIALDAKRPTDQGSNRLSLNANGISALSASSSSNGSGGARQQRFNMALLKEYETFSLENPALVVPARIVDCMLNWAIDNEPEGSDAQAELASLLYKFHRRRSTTISRGSSAPPATAAPATAVPKKSNPAPEQQQPPPQPQQQQQQQQPVPAPKIPATRPQTGNTGKRVEFDEKPVFVPSSANELIDSEREYVKKLERLVEKHHIASSAAKQLVFRTSTSSNSQTGDGRGAVLRLASSFGGQSIASEAQVLTTPSVFSCLSACEQMLTIHKSLSADLATLGSDSLHRLASLTKVYASYGSTLVEAYLAVNQWTSSSPSHKTLNDSNNEDATLGGSSASTGWFRLGASQNDPEDALRWVLMACGCVKSFKKPPADLSKWSLLDLLMCPLERMNDYCQFARELDSPALPALNETRRLLTKSIMRKSNTRLLREIDNGFVDLNSSLVDVRRWMLRSSPLVLHQDGMPDCLVQCFLFSDMFIVAQNVGVQDRWSILKMLSFSDGNSPIFVRDAVVLKPATTQQTSSSLLVLNPANSPLGDVRFAFEIGTNEQDVMTLLIPNVPAMIQKQANAFWSKLGLVSYDRETACAIGPGGFSTVDASALLPRKSGTDAAAAVKSSDRSKDMKRKQQLRWDWMSDIGRLIRIWGGAKTDACWFDDIVALRLMAQQQKLNVISSGPSPRGKKAGFDFKQPSRDDDLTKPQYILPKSGSGPV